MWVHVKLCFPGVSRHDIELLHNAAADVSITAHGGIINAVLRVIGRGNFGMTTGGKYSPTLSGVLAKRRHTGVMMIVVKGTIN